MSIAGGLSAPVLVTLSRFLGSVVFDWLEAYEASAIPISVGVALVVWAGVKAFEIFATLRSHLRFLAKSRQQWLRLQGRTKKSGFRDSDTGKSS